MNKKIALIAAFTFIFIGSAYSDNDNSGYFHPDTQCGTNQDPRECLNNFDKKLEEHTTHLTENTSKLGATRESIVSLNLSKYEQGKQLKKHQHSINQLYDTQYRINGNLILFEGQRVSYGISTGYNINREKIDNVGLNFTYRFGESYQDKLNKRLEILERQLKKQEKHAHVLLIKEGQSEGE